MVKNIFLGIVIFGLIISNLFCYVSSKYTIIPISPLSTEKAQTPQLPKVVEKQQQPKEQIRTPVIEKENSYDSWGYNIVNVNFDMIKKTSYDVVIIDLEKDGKLIDAETIKSLKTRADKPERQIFAYMSLGEAEDYRSYWKKEWKTNPPSWIGKENRIWKGNFEIKNLMQPEWLDIAKRNIDKAVASGYDGILINGLPTTNPKTTVTFMKEIVSYAKALNPSLVIFVQDAEDLATDSQFVSLVDGVVKQGLVYSKTSDGNKGKLNPEAILKRATDNLKIFTNNKKIVFVVEFVSGPEYKEAEKQIIANKFIPYSAPLRLDTLR